MLLEMLVTDQMKFIYEFPASSLEGSPGLAAAHGSFWLCGLGQTLNNVLRACRHSWLIGSEGEQMEEIACDSCVLSGLAQRQCVLYLNYCAIPGESQNGRVVGGPLNRSRPWQSLGSAALGHQLCSSPSSQRFYRQCYLLAL